MGKKALASSHPNKLYGLDSARGKSTWWKIITSVWASSSRRAVRAIKYASVLGAGSATLTVKGGVKLKSNGYACSIVKRRLL